MLSIKNLRKGSRYEITNYGDNIQFEVIEFVEKEIKVKNIDTLEVFFLEDIVRYGKGKDYQLIDLENAEDEAS